MVDVDGSGRPCKERHATVRWQGLLAQPMQPAPASSEVCGGGEGGGDRGGPAPSVASAEVAWHPLSGWGVIECGDYEQRRAALVRLGISQPARLAEIVGDAGGGPTDVSRPGAQGTRAGGQEGSPLPAARTEIAATRGRRGGGRGGDTRSQR